MSQYDAGLEMYFLVSGTCEALMYKEFIDPAEEEVPGGDRPPTALKGDLDERAVNVVATLAESDCFGEAALICNLLQPFSVRTATLCRVRGDAAL